MLRWILLTLFLPLQLFCCEGKGFTLFLTGLSGAGKSTLGEALIESLNKTECRSITFLDGDVIRTHLSSELGFSAKDRSTNVRRVGFVANEITKNGGIAICAMIAPYGEDRDYNRELISARGRFVEIFVSTPIKTCEERDVKGLYAKAREGIIPNFTGVSDPYEEPENPELSIDTTDISVEEAVDRVLSYLKDMDLLCIPTS